MYLFYFFLIIKRICVCVFFSGNFLGDIAIPGVEYSDKNEKDRRAYAEKVEKYKKEINEGLQIEEEGIVQGTAKAINVPQIKIRHGHNNRTRKSHLNKKKNADRPDKTVVDNSLSRYNFVYHVACIARNMLTIPRTIMDIICT